MSSANKIRILCIDDDPDVLRAVARDLAPLEECIPVDTASSSGEARKLIERISAERNRLGLVLCDHIMPGQNGVDFLVELRQNPEFEATRRVLLTGEAGFEDTIEAINRAGITYYIAKPWDKDELLQVARDELSEYVINTDEDPLPYMKCLNQARLSEYVHRRNRTQTGI